MDKWPEEDVDADGKIRWCRNPKDPDEEDNLDGNGSCGGPREREFRAHDPVILISDTRGESWEIATTDDFFDGLCEGC